MKQIVDYEYEALQKKTTQQKAIKAKEKRYFKGWLIGIALWLVSITLLFLSELWYSEWLSRDFIPPPELLTEAEFHELVAGYPLLAQVYGCCYSEDMDNRIRGDLDRYEDLDGDGEWDIRVWFPLYGRYKSETFSYEMRDGKDVQVGHSYELRKEEPFVLNAYAYRYSIFDLGRGISHTPREEHVFGGDHTACLSITVRNPSPDHGEFREKVEEMLRIVRGE